MIRVIFISVQWAGLFFRSRTAIEAENLVLRQQLGVLRRKSPARPRLTGWDRLIFVLLYRLFPTNLDSIVIVKPETVVRWHPAGFRMFWRWKSRNIGGRPKIDLETRHLIRKISSENPLWGAPRIHGELLKLGIDVCEATVAKYMFKTPKRPGQSWKTFLDNHINDIASMDFAIVPTIGFKLLYCLVILDHRRRRIVSFGVTFHPTSQWVARQITEAFPWDQAPDYLIRDRDGAFGHVVQQHLDAMGIRDSPTSPRSAWQNGYVERVIGSIRRECLDHMIVLSEGHLRLVMRAYVNYYNNVRTHLSLGKDTPTTRVIQSHGCINSIAHLGGLHHQYIRM
jgi:transposase InsO family protein